MNKIDKEELHILFERIKGNDNSAFECLYKNYKDLVRNISFSICKDSYISEEVVQIVYLKIFQIKKSNLPTSFESSWLYTITKNQTIELLRKKFNYIDIDTIYDIKDANNQINNIIDKDYYNKVITGLDEKEKEIISLKLLSNFTFKEIGDLINMPVGTVQWNYYKSLHSLKFLITNLMILILSFSIYIKSRKPKKSYLTNITQSTNKNSSSTSYENPSIIDSITQETTGTVSIASTPNSIIQISSFSLSCLFLIFTIIFSIIFVKYQQKRHKKTSKYYMGK